MARSTCTSFQNLWFWRSRHAVSVFEMGIKVRVHKPWDSTGVNLVLVHHMMSVDVSWRNTLKCVKTVVLNYNKLKVYSVDETGEDKLWYQKSHAETVTTAEFEMASNAGLTNLSAYSCSVWDEFWTSSSMASPAHASLWNWQTLPSLWRNGDYSCFEHGYCPSSLMGMASPVHASLWNWQILPSLWRNSDYSCFEHGY